MAVAYLTKVIIGSPNVFKRLLFKRWAPSNHQVDVLVWVLSKAPTIVTTTYILFIHYHSINNFSVQSVESLHLDQSNAKTLILNSY